MGLPTLKMIQAAKTKEFLLAGIAGYHCRMSNTYRTSAVGTEEEEKANTNSHLAVGTKIVLTGITLKNAVRTKKYD